MSLSLGLKIGGVLECLLCLSKKFVTIVFYSWTPSFYSSDVIVLSISTGPYLAQSLFFLMKKKFFSALAACFANCFFSLRGFLHTFLRSDTFVVKSIQNPLGKMAIQHCWTISVAHAPPRLTMDARFPVVLLESPTSCVKRISVLQVHAIFDNRDDTVGL